MDISIPKNPKIALIPKAVMTIKKHSIDLNEVITKDILSKSNIDQFLFLIGIASYEGKNFNLNFSHIKFYIQNVIKDNKEHLLKIEAILHEIFLKKYELKGYRLTFRSKYKAADIEKKRNSIVPGGLFEISKSDEKKLDVYEDYPILYKKIYFDYYNSKVMTYTMVSKSEFRYPTERYLNVVKRGYKDCKLDRKYLLKALINH